MNKESIIELLEAKKVKVDDRFAVVEAREKTVTASIELLTEQGEGLATQRDKLDSKLEKIERYFGNVDGMKTDENGDFTDTAKFRNISRFLKL